MKQEITLCIILIFLFGCESATEKENRIHQEQLINESKRLQTEKENKEKLAQLEAKRILEKYGDAIETQLFWKVNNGTFYDNWSASTIRNNQEATALVQNLRAYIKRKEGALTVQFDLNGGNQEWFTKYTGSIKIKLEFYDTNNIFLGNIHSQSFILPQQKKSTGQYDKLEYRNNSYLWKIGIRDAEYINSVKFTID